MKILSALIVVCALALIILSVSACAGKGMVRASEIAPAFQEVRARHDAYVKADASLTSLEQGIFLRSSALVQKTLDTATSTPAE